jgi:hypothetical protein
MMKLARRILAKVARRIHSRQGGTRESDVVVTRRRHESERSSEPPIGGREQLTLRSPLNLKMLIGDRCLWMIKARRSSREAGTADSLARVTSL